jgi:hypothetical protein
VAGWSANSVAILSGRGLDIRVDDRICGGCAFPRLVRRDFPRSKRDSPMAVSPRWKRTALRRERLHGCGGIDRAGYSCSSLPSRRVELLPSSQARDIPRDGLDLGVRQIFVSGHVGSRQTEFDDLRETKVDISRIRLLRDVAQGSGDQIRREILEIGTPPYTDITVGIVARGAVFAEECCSVQLTSLCSRSTCGAPGRGFFQDVLKAVRTPQAFEIRHQIVAPAVPKQIRVTGHNRTVAHTSRIDQVDAQPKRRAASANLAEVWPLAPVADERRPLPPDPLASTKAAKQSITSFEDYEFVI